MRILVLGAAGMLGRKLAQRLTTADAIEGMTISRLSLVDIEEPERPAADFEVGASVADLTSRSAVADLVSDRPDLIFHLAAVVSGEAEDDFEKGYRVNLDGVRTLFEEIRLVGTGYRPRVVFCSSIAVFGPPLPDLIGDEQRTTPATSYGTQKAIAELLLSDYSRRGFIDGIGLRLPTICVRPGKPNQAASGFFSSIIREPLNGEEATLPVPTDVRHWFASPRSGVGFLVHAAALDTALLGQHRCLTMPGVSATVATQIDALRRAAGDEAVALIRHEPDETISRIVATWPGAFDARWAGALGFRAETNFDDIIRAHIEDELSGRIAATANSMASD